MLSLAKADGPNFAPTMGLERSLDEASRDQSVFVKADWFKKESARLQREDEDTWKEQALLWGLIYNMMEGRQIGRRGRNGQWRWMPLPERTDSPVHALNLVGFYSGNIKAKWTQSSTDVRWRPTRDTDDATGAAKGAQVAFDYYKRRLYTGTFRQTEAMLAQAGKYARYFYYSDEAKGYARRPKYGTATVGFGGGAYFCADCGSSGEIGGGVQPSSAEMPYGGAGGLGMVAGTQPQGEDVRLEPPHLGREASPDGVLEGGIPQAGAPDAGGGPLDAGLWPEAAGIVCPDCGSPNVEIESAPPVEVQTLEGYEEYETGDLCVETVPCFELKHDLGCAPHESPYLIRSRRVRTALLQSKFPFLKVKGAVGESAGLQAEEALRDAVYGSMRSGSTSPDSEDGEQTDFIQCWLDPCLYSRFVLEEPFRTLDGAEIPAGTRLIDIFPDGIYLCKVEGVDGVVELRNEHHRDFWVGGVYRPRAISALGSGIEDMIEGNRQYNLVTSLIYTTLLTAGAPATLIDQRLLPNNYSAYLGHPGKNIPVNLAALPDKRLADAVHQLSPNLPGQQFFAYSDTLNNYMQMASRVTDFSGGLPGVNNDTATGAQIAAANSQGLFAPQLELKAEVDRRSAEIILGLFKKYCIDERYVSLAGRRGRMDGQWLKAADLSVDLYAEVVEGSYLPQTNLERRERLERFFALVGGPENVKLLQQEMPAMLERLAEVCDVDLGDDDYTAAAELCRERIEQMKAAVPMLQIAMAGMPPVQMAEDPLTGEMGLVPTDPEAEAGQFLLGVINPPIEVEELGHLSSIWFLRSWLTEDEAKEAPPELRAGVKAAIYRHLEGVVAEASLTGLVGAAGDPMGMAGPPAEGGPEPKNKRPDASQMGGPKKPAQKKQPAGV